MARRLTAAQSQVGLVGQDGVVYHAFQLDPMHLLLDHGADGAPVPDCLKPVNAGRPPSTPMYL